VRHHELGVTSGVWRVASNDAASGENPVTRHSSLVTHLARIEVGPTELPKFLEQDLSTRVAAALKKIGYAHVTLDLLGYRRGSLNVAPGAKDQVSGDRTPASVA